MIPDFTYLKTYHIEKKGRVNLNSPRNANVMPIGKK